MKQINIEGERIEVDEDWNCCLQPEEVDQTGIADALRRTRESYRRDLWASQTHYVEAGLRRTLSPE